MLAARPGGIGGEMLRVRSLDGWKKIALAGVLVVLLVPPLCGSSDEIRAAMDVGGVCARDTGILIVQSDHNLITGNSVTGNRIGIFLLDSNGNAVAENNISNNREYGLFLERSGANSILRNGVYLNGFSGISLWDSPNNALAYNEAGSNRENGISLWGSRGNSLSNNIACLNGQWGIYFFKSHGNCLLENNASFNGENGLIFAESEGNVLGRNVVKNNLGVCGDICSYNSSRNFFMSYNFTKAAHPQPNIPKFKAPSSLYLPLFLYKI
jgi:parallel beta-helix repeat protein